MRRDALPASPVGTAPEAAWRAVYDAACEAYRGAGRWPYHWARGKLARDPVFRALLQRGDLRPHARVLDIGGGQGLVAALLHASALAATRQPPLWPASWPAAPSARAYTCIELMARDADRGRRALASLPFAPQFVCADMRVAPFPPCDLVVILDVLHYVDHAAQDEVLRRVRDALLAGTAGGAGGRLLLRVGDASRSGGFAASQWVDRIVTAVRGHRAPPTWGRPLAQWTLALQGLGFAVRSVPMSQGTPFANVLLVADLPGAG